MIIIINLIGRILLSILIEERLKLKRSWILLTKKYKKILENEICS